jgi:hypothetical protein
VAEVERGARRPFTSWCTSAGRIWLAWLLHLLYSALRLIWNVFAPKVGAFPFVPCLAQDTRPRYTPLMSETTEGILVLGGLFLGVAGITALVQHPIALVVVVSLVAGFLFLGRCSSDSPRR